MEKEIEPLSKKQEYYIQHGKERYYCNSEDIKQTLNELMKDFHIGILYDEKDIERRLKKYFGKELL